MWSPAPSGDGESAQKERDLPDPCGSVAHTDQYGSEPHPQTVRAIHEISLHYACGCQDRFSVTTEPPAGLPTHSPFPCVPDDPKYPCQTCTEHGQPCPGRENLYRPIEWPESGAVGRVIKIPKTGSLAWESSR